MSTEPLSDDQLRECRDNFTRYNQKRLLAEIDRLKEENARLRDDVTGTNCLLEHVGQESDHFCKEADKLRAELSEAQRKARALDELEKQPGPGFKWWLQRLDSG